MMVAPPFHIFPAVDSSRSNITNARESIQCSSVSSGPSSPRIVESKEGERSLLCDAMLSEHFSSESRSFRLECLESKAANNDARINEVKGQLAAARSEESMECARWREKYTEAVAEANACKKEADFAEARLVSSAVVAAQASANRLQVEYMRTQIVESQEQWMSAERESLFAEINQLRTSISEAESSAAEYQLRVQKASVEAAQSIVGQFSKREALLSARNEARHADAMAAASEDAFVLAEKEALQAKSYMESMKVELETFRQNEEASMKRARDNAQFETEIARLAMRMESEQNEEWIASVRALEQERQRQVHSAMHVDERKALMQALCVVGHYGNDPKDAGQHLTTIEEHPRIDANVSTSAQKTRDADDYYVGRNAALASEAQFEQLRSELLASREEQEELQMELHALCRDVMAMRTAVVTKDARIQELEARTHIIHAGLTLKSSQQAKDLQFLFEGSASTLANECANKSFPHTPFDAVSVGSTLTTVSENGGSCEGGESTSSSSPQTIGTDDSNNPDIEGVAAPSADIPQAAVNAKSVRFSTRASSVVPDASDTLSTRQGQEKSPSHPEGLEESLQQLHENSSGESWEAIQMAMTNKIREDISLLRRAVSDGKSRAQSPLMPNRSVSPFLSRSTSPSNARVQHDKGAITSLEPTLRMRKAEICCPSRSPAHREEQPRRVSPLVRETIQNLFVHRHGERPDDIAGLASEGRKDASSEFKPSKIISPCPAPRAMRSLSPSRLPSTHAPVQRADPALRLQNADTSCHPPRKVSAQVRETVQTLFVKKHGERLDDSAGRASEIQKGRKEAPDFTQSELIRSSSPVRLQSTPAVVGWPHIGCPVHKMTR